MGFWTQEELDDVNRIAAKSKELTAQPKKKSAAKASSITSQINAMSENVIKYFADSQAILITSKDELHDYITKAIESGYAGIDTETTGLDRIKDTIVGASLYYPGGVECYIPIKHLVPIFDEPYKNQLTYEEVGEEFQRLADSDIKLIFANADFDLAMIYKDMKVDLCDKCYYDVILAWRCLKEDERDNSLKGLYSKYVLRGKGDPMKFSDFFTPELFPYCKPDVAKLYAANDAKITYELFKWQLPYATKGHPKCEKAGLSKIADLIWHVELPLIKICQKLHRTGSFVDKDVASKLILTYNAKRDAEIKVLYKMVDTELEKSVTTPQFGKRPFRYGEEFNPNSTPHVKYLLYTVMNLPKPENTESTGKEVLNEINLPVTRQILKVRSLDTLIGTFVDKMPKSTTPDSRIHAEFKQIGADTGRLSCQNPNLMNIPSHAADIRHMFRATPGYVLLSSDYSSQEPRLTAFIANEKSMIQAFQTNRDVYATIASLSFNLPYERCLEFHPETHEYQADGYERRSEAKRILLGITYGRSVPSIAEQLYGKRKDMTDDEKVESAQKIYDSVLSAFPNIKKIMLATQNHARKYGYTETILGRRRHLPDMQLPEYDFKPLDGYVNPDIDPLDPKTLENKDDIPVRIKKALYQEMISIKNFGKRAKRMRELHDRYHIQVINNRSKIARATRQCLNCVSLDTEILTVDGWKSYDAVSIGDSIYSYNIDTKSVERDMITNITVSHDKVNVMRFKSSAFESVSTMNHRWVVCESDGVPKIVDTAKICKNGYGDYPILRVSDNNFVSSNNYSDDELKVIGWFLTDGYFRTDPSYIVRLYQSTKRPKNLAVYNDMISTISRLGLQFNDSVTKDGHYHSIYLNKCDFTLKLISDFPNRELTSDFISTLSQSQANILMRAMLDGDGTVKSNGLNLNITCSNIDSAGLFQYLAFIAGYATNIYERTPEQFNSTKSSNKCYDSVSNTDPIKITKPYYIVSVLKRKRAQIWKSHQFPCEVDGVWCPTTNNSTWIARYGGKIFITGNSVVQGSASDQTKLAMIRLESNEEWQQIGGRLLIPVHDELIAEVPLEHYKRGGEILSQMMCEAADFLPFPSKCDVTTSLRWKGMEYPCPYPKPKNLTDITEDEVKWVQYHLCECEYILPVYKDENGDKPKGDAAVGVNGIVSDEYLRAVELCKQEMHATSDEEFIEKVEHYVLYYHDI